MVEVWFQELPSFQTSKLAYENSMLGVFSCNFTVVANDVIMQRTRRCLGLSENRQVNRHIVIWLARALRVLEASQHVIGLPTDHPWLMVGWSVSVLSGPSINNLLRPWNQLKMVKMNESTSAFYLGISTNGHMITVGSYVQFHSEIFCKT